MLFVTTDTTVVLNSCDRDCTPVKPNEFVAFYRKSLPVPGLDYSFIWKVILVSHLSFRKKFFPLGCREIGSFLDVPSVLRWYCKGSVQKH